MKKKAFIDQRAIEKYRKRSAKQLLPADHVYHELTQRLLSRLELIRMTPAVVVNMGWHVTTTHDALQARYPEATIINACRPADLQALAPASVDLVFMHFSMLCERDPLSIVQHAHRILRNEGLLLFVDVGPDTLMELRLCFSRVDALPHVHDFIDMHHIGDLLRALHFSDPVVDCERIELAYDTLDLLFQDLKTAGIMNAHEQRSRGLLSAFRFKKMMMEYEKLKQDDYYPASLEVIYGHAWKVSVQTQNDDQEICIAVDSIPTRVRGN